MAGKAYTNNANKDSMSIINEHIENNTFSNLYLLYGNEYYLLKQYKEKLLNAVISPDDTMNLSVYKGPSSNSDSIINDCQTLPFFSERRVVLVEDSEMFKNSNDELADFLTEVPDSTCLIFCEKEIDKRGRLYKAVSKYGCTLNFDTPDERTLTIWLKSVFKGEGLRVDDKALYKMLEAVGQDMTMLRNEAEKLIDYCYEKKVVLAADVDQLCISQIENKVFDMTDAISRHDKNLAIKLYNDLLMLREPPRRILALIIRHYNILSEVKLMTKEQANVAHIAKTVGVPPFAVKKYIDQCHNYNYKDLLHKVDLCQQADYTVKAIITPDKTAVEKLVIDLVM